MSKHKHAPPPGYLGAPPEPADPHDHRTSPPATAWRPGEPWISPGVEDVLPLSAVERRPEPRWHEIATEGLPNAPDGTWFLIYCPWREPEIQQAQLRDGGVWDLMDREFSMPEYERDTTHWMPMPDAPPTKEPR